MKAYRLLYDLEHGFRGGTCFQRVQGLFVLFQGEDLDAELIVIKVASLGEAVHQGHGVFKAVRIDKRPDDRQFLPENLERFQLHSFASRTAAEYHHCAASSGQTKGLLNCKRVPCTVDDIMETMHVNFFCPSAAGRFLADERR